MNSENVSQWIETITRTTDSNDLLAGKRKYHQLAGEIFQDDKSYESRMGSFLEWFTFERPNANSGLTPVEQYRQDNESRLSPEEKDFLSGLSRSIHGLFLLNKVRKEQVIVTELFDDIKYQVNETQQQFPFNSKDIFEGRLVPINGEYFFTGNFTYHPAKAHSFIHKKIKALQAVEKVSKKNLKTREKEQTKKKKALEACQKKLESIQKKLESATRENKRLKLEQQRQDLLEEESISKSNFNEAAQAVNTFRNDIIDHKIPADRFELIQKFSYMSLKWERSRQIELSDIYTD